MKLPNVTEDFYGFPNIFDICFKNSTPLVLSQFLATSKFDLKVRELQMKRLSEVFEARALRGR